MYETRGSHQKIEALLGKMGNFVSGLQKSPGCGRYFKRGQEESGEENKELHFYKAPSFQC